MISDSYIFLFIAILLMFGYSTFALGNTATKANRKMAIATFAGGCFWCMQPIFDNLEGVVSTAVGYTGGTTKNPSYEEVLRGGTGHLEAIQIFYDPIKISYETLLSAFWHNIDPTMAEGQFCDIGSQYLSAIFYHTKEQKQLAEKSKEELEQSEQFRSIATTIRQSTIFYPAEEYHQKYYQKIPMRYQGYHEMSGREARLKKLWNSKHKE